MVIRVDGYKAVIILPRETKQSFDDRIRWAKHKLCLDVLSADKSRVEDVEFALKIGSKAA